MNKKIKVTIIMSLFTGIVLGTNLYSCIGLLKAEIGVNKNCGGCPPCQYSFKEERIAWEDEGVEKVEKVEVKNEKCQKGKASYYGPYDRYSRMKFHGRRTASGERYNMYGMTAAHRTLPFDTVVTVTRERYEPIKKVEVRINDRGPYKIYRNSNGKVKSIRPHPSRIIDLSYGAAEKMNMLGTGVVPVTICWEVEK
jgi:hypothetical protein